MKRSVGLLAILLLAGCRVIQVAVGQEDPRPFASGLPLVDEGVVRPVAGVGVAFSSGEPAVTISAEPLPERDYILVGEPYHLRTQWALVWPEGTSDAAGGEIIVEIEGLGVVGEGYLDHVDKIGPDLWQDTVDAVVEIPEAGAYTGQAIIFMEVNGDVIEERIPFGITALPFPDESDRPAESLLEPAFGELEYDGIFLDWRAWYGGPCRLEADTPETIRLLDEACLFATELALVETADLLLEALDQSRDDPVLQARLRDQLGVIYAVFGDWEIAARQFRESLRIWETQADTLATAAALHNLGTAEMMLGQDAAGEALLIHAVQIRDLADDWPAVLLTWALFSVYAGDPEALFE
ncbi:MAG: tetratricopeptide repeat protein, partial [Anaerolineae bacterium]